MPVNAEQVAYAGVAAIDHYLENDPVDQVNIAHPLLEKLMEGKKEYSGAKQYVVEQLRTSNDSAFMSFHGSGQVSFNNRRSLAQASFTYGAYHDGFGIDHDELIRNGITLTDDRGAVPTADEKVNITNIMQENTEILTLGMKEGIDLVLHRDGTADPDSIAGLDALISITPSSGTVGGIAASNAYWQNYADLTLGSTVSEFIDAMETAWDECIRYGGSTPNFILVGQDFKDAYRNAARDSTNLQVVANTTGGNRTALTLDAGIGSGIRTGLFFKGVELIWDPTFEMLDTLDAPTVTWSSRCYFINTKHLVLRPIVNQWMKSHRPPRVYDRFVNYTSLTSRFALTTGKRRAHAVLALG